MAVAAAPAEHGPWSLDHATEALLVQAAVISKGPVCRTAMWRALAQLHEADWMRLVGHPALPDMEVAAGPAVATVSDVPVDGDALGVLRLSQHLAAAYDMPDVGVGLRSFRPGRRPRANPWRDRQRQGAGSAEGTRRWRAVSVASVLIALVLLASSPARRGPAAGRIGPPYPRVALADALLTTADVDSALRSTFVPQYDGPPSDHLHTSSGPLARDLLEATQIAAWRRTWISVDQHTFVSLALTEYRRTEYLHTQCQGLQVETVPGADRAGFATVNGRYSTGCAYARRGRTLVAVGD